MPAVMLQPTALWTLNTVQLHGLLHPLLAHRNTACHQFAPDARPVANAMGCKPRSLKAPAGLLDCQDVLGQDLGIGFGDLKLGRHGHLAPNPDAAFLNLLGQPVSGIAVAAVFG